MRFSAYEKDEGFSSTRPASFPLLLWENGLLYTTFKELGAVGRCRKAGLLTEERVSQTTLKGFLDENAQVGRFHAPVLYVHGSGHCLRQPVSVRFANELHQKKSTAVRVARALGLTHWL